MATALPVGRRERFAQWWQLRTAAERNVIVITAVIIAVLLLWVIVWEPLQRDRERLARQNLKSAAGPIERIDDEHWHLSFAGVAFDALTPLLESLQRDSGLRASEVSATARVEPGQVRADVTLTR